MDKKVDIYTFLGLPAGAPRSEVAARCEKLQDWLAGDAIPEPLRRWAAGQRAILTELYERLDLATEEGDETSDTPRLEDATVSVRGEAATAKPAKRGGLARAATSYPVLLALFGVAAGLAAVLGVLWWRGVIFTKGVAANDHTNTEQTFDPAAYLAERAGRLQELKQTVAANPNDTAALFEIGETYITGEDWANADLWFERLIALTPDDVHVLTDIGTAKMNMDDYAGAEEWYNKVVAKDPNNVQVYYNLGWLFAFRADAPDLNKTVTYWEKVVELAPDSELAQSVQTHIDQFKQMSSGGQ